MFSRVQLRILARAYLDQSPVSAAALGRRICDNHKFIKGLLDGRDITASNAELASEWFLEHWPPGAAWPLAEPRPCKARVPA